MFSLVSQLNFIFSFSLYDILEKSISNSTFFTLLDLGSSINIRKQSFVLLYVETIFNYQFSINIHFLIKVCSNFFETVFYPPLSSTLRNLCHK